MKGTLSAHGITTPFYVVIALMMLDLPTLDLPTKQHSGKSALGIL